jgi:HD-like signal output (HDOD) protein
VVDDSLAEPERVCFEPGVRGLLVEVSSDDFQFLLGAARRAAFARPLPPGGHPMPDLTLAVRPEVRQLLQGATAEAVQERLSRQYRLPTMPGTAVQMLALAANPNVKVSDLAGVIRLDPSLAAQVVRYARSPFFAYRGKVESIEDAITRVLGLDMVLNLAVGIAVGKSLRIPRGGPLGIEAFWRHSVYAAALAQGLSKGVPRRLGARPGMAYLTGLLHNLGFLLLGHLFQPEFYLLNKLVLNNPDVPVTALEDELFGMDFGHQESPLGHARLGGWLMQRWQMPPEVVVTVREHHHADYAGEHAVYVRLVQVANHLLKRAGLGDAPDPLLSLPLLHSLELSEAQVLATFESVSEAGGGLDVMAQQLAA